MMQIKLKYELQWIQFFEEITMNSLAIIKMACPYVYGLLSMASKVHVAINTNTKASLYFDDSIGWAIE